MVFSFVLFLVERSALAGSGVETEPAGFGRKISCSAFPCPRPHHPRSRRISEVASGVWGLASRLEARLRGFLACPGGPCRAGLFGMGDDLLSTSRKGPSRSEGKPTSPCDQLLAAASTNGGAAQSGRAIGRALFVSGKAPSFSLR
jgi:hypothetical protein